MIGERIGFAHSDLHLMPIAYFSNAVILNPSFSLALSRFLLTIITPWLSVRYAHACINRMDSPTDKRGLFLNNLDIIFISSPNLLPEIKSNALEREGRHPLLQIWTRLTITRQHMTAKPKLSSFILFLMHLI